MVVVPAPGKVTFEWPPIYEDGPAVKEVIDLQSFAIGSTEVTLSQVNELLNHAQHDYQVGPTNAHPANKISFNLAAKYCNLLSEKAGIPTSQWCYKILKDGSVVVVEDYHKRTGFRFPRESEWEYASAAGTKQPTFFGSNDLANYFAWHRFNTDENTSAVGQLLSLIHI